MSGALRDPVVAYIGIGANLGAAADMVRRSMDAIGRLPHVALVLRSSLYRTAPIGSDGPDYINAVVAVRTAGTAPALLAGLAQLERAALRQRCYRNAPRTLDLDLLLFGDASIDSAVLSVPHPRMLQRAFVLVPLAEIAPHRVDAACLRQVADQVCEKLG